MAFFDDFATGIQGYPAASVTLTINTPVVETGTAGGVNVNEVWSFTVRVTNTGRVTMKNVTVHAAAASTSATVATALAGPYSTLVTSAALVTVPAGGSATTGKFFFKAAAAATAAPVDLVSVHINNWDADLANLLVNLAAHADPPNNKFTAQVFP